MWRGEGEEEKIKTQENRGGRRKKSGKENWQSKSLAKTSRSEQKKVAELEILSRMLILFTAFIDRH